MCFVDYLRLCIHKNKEVAREFEHTRVLYSIILNTNVTKKSDQKKPQNIIPLWTDRLNKKDIGLTEFDRDRITEYVKNRDGRQVNNSPIG